MRNSDHVPEMDLPWWSYLRTSPETTCVYCGSDTTGELNREHMIPESLGFKDLLYEGAVCFSCNQSLNHSVDQRLLREPMICAGLIRHDVKGKKGLRTSLHKVRKTVHEGKPTIHITGESGSPNYHFVCRGIAKCAVNILTNVCGAARVRKHMGDAIDFVRNPKSRQEVWPVWYRAMPEVNLRPQVILRPMYDKNLLVVSIAFPGSLVLTVPNRDRGDVLEILRENMREIVEKHPEMQDTLSFETSMDMANQGRSNE